MNDTKEYLNYPTITSLSNKDKEEYRTRHISIADLMRYIEELQKRNIESSQRELLFEQKIGKLEKRIAELENMISKGSSLRQPVQKKSNVSIGDTVSFGKYDGKEIEWIVLDEKKDGSKLLLSKYILLRKAYNDKRTSVTWETCTLRNWLNKDLYQEAFSNSEQSKIQTTQAVNNDNKTFETEAGKDTIDKIFLLSIEEAKQYFDSDEERIARRLDNNDTWSYWLRSPGISTLYAADVNFDGCVYEDGLGVDDDYSGVRPALWANL